MKYFLFLFTIFFLSALPASAQESQYTSGTLIKSVTSSAVYYIGDDGKRHAFPNAHVYFSWYEDFSEVQQVTEFDMASIPLGKNVLYRPGSRLIKTPSVNEVYAVGPWGELRNIASEQVAIALYGEDWAKLVDDIDISFFFDYHIVGVIDSDGENIIYPRGSLIFNDGYTWVIDTRSTGEQIARPISGQAWIDNDFDALLTYQYNGLITDQYDVGLPVYIREERFTCPYCLRANFDNLTVFETNYFNTALNQYTVSGRLPEDWNIDGQVTDSNILRFVTGGGSAYLDVSVTEMEQATNEDQGEVMQNQSPIRETNLYSGVDLADSNAQAQVYTNTGLNRYILSYTDTDFIYSLSFYNGAATADETFTLEKHWDEIETIIENIAVSRQAS